MAALHFSILSSSVGDSANATATLRKPVRNASSLSISPPPPKPKRRKNHLRPKLLKTLAKPYPAPLLPFPDSEEPLKIPQLPFDSGNTDAATVDASGDSCSVAAEENGGSGETLVQIEEDAAAISAGRSEFYNSNSSVESLSSGSLIRFVLWAVGAFVFQTFCAVWVLGSVDFNRIDGSLKGKDESLEGKDGRKTARQKLNGNGSFFFGKNGLEQKDLVSEDVSDLEEKITQIRAMAREVRKEEEKEQKRVDDGFSMDDLDDGEAAEELSRGRSRVGKEVDERLIKIQKMLESKGEKPIASLISQLKNPKKAQDRKQADSALAKESNGAFMFEKKFKFRSPSTDLRTKPKGFQKRENGKRLSISLEGRNEQKPLIEDPKFLRKDEKVFRGERVRIHSEEEIRLQDAEPKLNGVQKTSDGKSSAKGVSTEVAIQNGQKLEGKQGDNRLLRKAAGFGTKSSLRSKGVKSESPNKKVMDEQPNIGKDFWWSELPYVLAIYMRRGSNLEGPGGLFTLKTESRLEDQSDPTYTVTFVDRGDAINFCYVLETFFEDLGDFEADIVPLSIKELKETLASHTKKVVVVKKGQIQLYAGQPLPDVEMALRKIIEQEQVADSPQSK